MPDSEQKNILHVQASESGQKLLQFLIRRLSLPQSLLHRWIRTGQIRLNGSRVKPFTQVATGDTLRLPPFALGMNQSAVFEKSPESLSQNHTSTQHLKQKTASCQNTTAHESAPFLRAKAKKTVHHLPPVIYSDENIYIYNKPQGLPIHAGTGHVDTLAARLQAHFHDLVFKPTPAHRLDKDTSGLLCVAFSYSALRTLQDAFATRCIAKEYLAWVHGAWPQDGPCKLVHHMNKKYEGYHEKVRILSADDGKEAVSYAQCLQRTQHYSLMHIRLITGRTHQIRLQMAAQGHPVLGDGKYGNATAHTALYLHSLRIIFPQTPSFQALHLAGKEFAALPTWSLCPTYKESLVVESLPLPLQLS